METVTFYSVKDLTTALLEAEKAYFAAEASNQGREEFMAAYIFARQGAEIKKPAA